MKVKLINKETKEVIMTFENVDKYGENFVEYKNYGYRAKTHCDPNQIFLEDKGEEQENETT